MPTATSTDANLEPSKVRRSVQRALGDFVLPALAATLGTWGLHLDRGMAPHNSLGRALEWLGGQPVLLWALLFAACGTVTSYWRRQLFGEAPKQPRSTSERLRDLLIVGAWVGAAAALAFCLRAWVGEVGRVRSTSMLPTLYPGDLTWVSRRNAWFGLRSRPPTRGEVVLFEAPDPAVRELESLLFKRVVGLEGDTLSVQDGAPVINGWGVPRCLVGRVSLPLQRVDVPTEPQLWVEWLGDAAYLTLSDGLRREAAGPFTVKHGEIWVLGDNRDHSVDSRNWFGGRGGGVPGKNVLGSPSVLLANAEGLRDRGLRRTQSLELPKGAESLTPILAQCLSLKPKQTLPPEPK